MSNLLKSKFILGFVVVAMVLVGVSFAKADNTCTLTMTLKQGMRNADVSCLQAKLGVTPATGYFGSITKAKVMAFQASQVPALTADGVVGPMTRAAINGTAVAVTGNCPAGYVSTTPVAPTFAACVVATPAQGSCPAGYVAVTPVAPTFAACALGTGTPASTGTNGYLADENLDSTGRVSTAYESETDQVVAGIRLTARLADQTVNRVRVTFLNADTTGSSTNLSKYITGATLWLGSTKLATMPVSMADRNTSTDLYTFNFAGLNSVIAKDQIGRFYVTVDVASSIDTGNSAANWTVSFVAGGISATSPDGSYDTYPGSPIAQTGLQFGKFSANGVKATVGISSTNPAASTLAVSSTSATNGVELLRFTVKATNSDLTLRKVPIQITKGTAAIGNIINTLYLYSGTNVMQSVDGSSGVTGVGGIVSPTYRYTFDNLASPYNVIPAGTTAEFVVKADLKAESTGVYADGETLTTSLTYADFAAPAYFSVQDVNGDQLPTTSSYRVGSAIGNIMTLRASGVNVAMTQAAPTTTSNTGGLVTTATWNIPVTVTSFGSDLYTGTTSLLTAADGAAFEYVIEDSSNVSIATGVSSAALSTSDASTVGSGYLLNSDSAKHFTVSVTLTKGTAAAGYYHVRLTKVRTYTTSAITTGANQDLVPTQSFRTLPANIQA